MAPENAADLALGLVDRTNDGIVVNGARMLTTLGPLSKELLVLPSAVPKVEPGAGRFALAFAITGLHLASPAK